MSHVDDTIDYVTFTIGKQLFGLPINRVEDVFKPEAITRVPLSRREIAGVLNLRGRIVTAIDMRHRLGLEPASREGAMAVGVTWRSESYGLLIDGVGEVMRLAPATLEPNPVNLHPTWVGVWAGVFRMDGRLLVVIYIDRVLAFDETAVAA